MSDRSSNRLQPGQTTRDGTRAASAAPSPPFRSATGVRSVTSPVPQKPGENAGRLFELPPLPQQHGPMSGSFSPSATRLSGVSSILNPQSAEEAASSRRRKASQLDSPSTSSVQSLPPIISGAQRSQTTPTLHAPSPVSQHGDYPKGPPRHILTPRSPSLHHTASLGQLNQSTAPSASTLPTATATNYKTAAPRPPTPPSDVARRASDGTVHTRYVSGSASPRSSFSSYSHADRTSPAIQHGFGSLSTSQGPQHTSHDGQHSMGVPVSSSSGHNVYQMMTLETTSGTVELPVDVQAASRVADEKRRRNAGASARFRQRRKEKEKEASSTISRMEQQLKELSEDADFYRRERDFLSGILTHVPGGERHFPRPPSPRHRRSSARASTDRSPGDGRSVRRKTSNLPLPPPPPPPRGHQAYAQSCQQTHSEPHRTLLPNLAQMAPAQQPSRQTSAATLPHHGGAPWDPDRRPPPPPSFHHHHHHQDPSRDGR